MICKEEIVLKEFDFLKAEQRYMESKLNILGASIISANSFILIAINNFFQFSKIEILILLFFTLFPIIFLLIGILPLRKVVEKNENYEKIKILTYSHKKENQLMKIIL
ncbi:hypothetical protein SCLARK_001281 [Spiroplasma clarkii]|uniref:hypothetical protein n=1 Tax=Spiroplasma clarkii TaxID=2139 RepID=UPI000B55DAE3|nr:hypothetical protein [Spiroplasma clarkii]ARU91821.1 hypothetical protein SCLARK_001281 [Spiroplasma clarkii]